MKRERHREAAEESRPEYSETFEQGFRRRGLGEDGGSFLEEFG